MLPSAAACGDPSASFHQSEHRLDKRAARCESRARSPTTPVGVRVRRGVAISSRRRRRSRECSSDRRSCSQSWAAQSADVELVGLYWTVSGPVVVHFGREWSFFSWADRCAEARKVGFAGLGIWHADLEHVLETETLADMKQAMDDNGLTQLELEFLMDWFLDPGDERRDGVRRDARPALRGRRGARRASHQGREHPRHAGVARRSSPSASASSATIAAERTDAKIVYEFMPFDVERQDARRRRSRSSAARRAERRHRDRHLAHVEARHRARRPPSDPARVPELGRALRRQFADMDDPIDEVINHRNLPGEGEFDITGYIEVCRGSRLPGPVGRRDALRGAAQQPDRRHLPAGFRARRSRRNSAGAFERTRGADVSRHADEAVAEEASTATGSSGCTTRCCGSASSRSGSSARSSSTRA